MVAWYWLIPAFLYGMTLGALLMQKVIKDTFRNGHKNT